MAILDLVIFPPSRFPSVLLLLHLPLSFPPPSPDTCPALELLSCLFLGYGTTMAHDEISKVFIVY